MNPRSLRRSQKKLITSIVALVLGLIVVGAGQLADGGLKELQQSYAPVEPGYYKVIEAVDGDTLVVDMDGIKERVRMVGVDTPETHHPSKPTQCFGPEASTFTKEQLSGKQVKLRPDQRQPNRDKYNRLLRYVYTQDGREMNELLISGGYGFATRGFNLEKKAAFIALEEAAKNEKKGLWSACTVDGAGRYPQTNSID